MSGVPSSFIQDPKQNAIALIQSNPKVTYHRRLVCKSIEEYDPYNMMEETFNHVQGPTYMHASENSSLKRNCPKQN